MAPIDLAFTSAGAIRTWNYAISLLVLVTNENEIRSAFLKDTGCFLMVVQSL